MLSAAPPPTTLEDRRAQMEAAMGGLPLAEGTVAEEIDAGGVRIVACRREGAEDDPVLLYFHGGGYRLGSARSYRAYGSNLARACSLQVLLVDYRLAPECPFPAAVEDALHAYGWALERHEPGTVVVGGDSAGGGLAAALLLASRDEGLPAAAGAACLSPWADLTNTAASFLRCSDTDALFSKAAAEEAALLYLQGADPTQPLASPVYGNWTGLPPLLVQASEDEVLADDASTLAAVAEKAGVAVELHLYPGMPHVWQLSYPAFPEAVQAVEELGNFVRRVTAAA